LNAQGASGNAYMGPFILGNVQSEVFVKAQSGTTYQYAADASIKTVSGFVAALNARGAQGYVFKGPMIFEGSSTEYDVFVKSSAKTGVYSYQVSDYTAVRNTVLEDMNARGAQGFAYAGDLFLATDNKFIRLFVKDSGSSATYSYQFKPLLTNRDALLSEINSLGANGFVWKGGYVFGLNDQSFYEKASTTTSAVSFAMPAAVTSNMADLMAQANQFAAQGNYYWGAYQIAPGNTVSVYYKGPPTTLPLLGVVIP
jgi:hypothetical protein